MPSSKPAIKYHWVSPLITMSALFLWIGGCIPLRVLILILAFILGLKIYRKRFILFKNINRLPANVTTSTRVLLILIIPWFDYSFDGITLTILYLAAALMDGLDGFFARMLSGESEAGADFDEAADAIFLISISIGLIVVQDIGWWVLIPVISRECWLIVQPFISSHEFDKRFAFAKWIAGVSFALLPFCFILSHCESAGIALLVVTALSGSFIWEAILLMKS